MTELTDQGEPVLAFGGAIWDQAGCLLVPFLNMPKTAGRLIVTPSRITFQPVLHYALVARKFTILLSEVEGALVSGAGMEFNVMDIVTIGQRLTVSLMDGRTIVFRTLQAEPLAAAINWQVQRMRGRG